MSCRSNDLGISLLELTYGYDNRDLPITLTEEGTFNVPATTLFTYDNRGRLIEEYRTDGPIYTREYTYDNGGNRLTMYDFLGGTMDVYTYDLDDPATYQTENNRLMFVESFDIGGGGQDPLSTTYYYYNDVGNVERILTRSASQNEVTVTRLHYAANQVAVTFILGEHWDWDGVAGSCPTNYGVDYAFEYYYDGPRVRWAKREIDLSTLNDTDSNYGVLTTVFSEYDGNQIYNDFTIDHGDVTVLRSYEPGVGHVTDPLDPANRVTKYYHPDKIGTTRALTWGSSALTDASVYTAFGELVDGTNHRYGYAGTSGYQAHDEFSLLHVGSRYYDPAIGRFVQRDPIGFLGGLNVYEYAGSAPTVFVDPSGLFSRRFLRAVKIATRVARKAASATIRGGGSPAGVALGPINVTARALEGAPDGIRVYMACGVRSNAIKNGVDANDILDRLERGRKYIKPGKGN